MGSVLGLNPSTVYAASEGRRFAADSTLVVVSCATCGVTYAIPESFDRSAQEYHGDRPNGWKICCPFGHTWWYVGETEVERLARERDDARRRSQATRDLLDHEQRSHAATRGHLTRQKRRIAGGTCPCCHRTFQQLARHMATKHPDFIDHDPGHLPADVLPVSVDVRHQPRGGHLEESVERIVREKGPISPSAIVAELGYSTANSVGVALHRLKESGRVQRLGYGRWVAA